MNIFSSVDRVTVSMRERERGGREREERERDRQREERERDGERETERDRFSIFDELPDTDSIKLHVDKDTNEQTQCIYDL